MSDEQETTVSKDSIGQSASTGGLGVITREEWTRRYSAQIMKRAGWTQSQADEVAAIGADEYERQELECGTAVIWWGGPSGANNTPEDEADEEMSYWTDDGE